MRKVLKIVGLILLVPILAFAGLVGWMLLFQLPANSPRVVETDDYRYAAPDNWNTACAGKAPGCIAVDTGPDDRLWSSRRHWIEVQAVDAGGVTDAETFAKRAAETVEALVRAGGGNAAEIVHVDEAPAPFDGADIYDLEDATAARFSRSRFVRFPAGNILRFTCYGENAVTGQEHDAACLAALEGLNFPQAAALAAAEQERAAREQQDREEQARAEQAKAQEAQAQQARAQASAARASSQGASGADIDAAIDSLVAKEREIGGFLERERADGRAQRQQQPGALQRFVTAATNAARLTRVALTAATASVGPFGLQIPPAQKKAAQDAILAAQKLTVDPQNDTAMDILWRTFSMPQLCEVNVSYMQLQKAFDVKDNSAPPDAACKLDVLRGKALDKVAEVDRYLATAPGN